MTVTADQFRAALGRFASGVTVVTARTPEGDVHGMTASAFSSLSLEPFQVLVCVGRGSRTHPILSGADEFGVSILSDEQQHLAEFFARIEKDRASAERTGARFTFTATGTPLLEGSLAALECRVVSKHDSGDHTIFIGEVESVRLGEGLPLLYYRGRYCHLEAHEKAEPAPTAGLCVR
jgi:flavin reductase (DIM6/NTAB) family NADH-FMN oxidoreductase RutF